MERWADVKGFEGVYQISTLGRLKSFKKIPSGRILSNKNRRGDYFSVVLSANGRTKHTRIHRLVLEAFVPNPDNKPQVNHKDGDRQNNCVLNLEWVSRSENVRDAIKRNPNTIRGMNYYNQFVRPKPIRQLSLNGQLLAEYPNGVTAGQVAGVCARNILQVANKEEYKPGKRRMQAGGFLWEFKQDCEGYER